MTLDRLQQELADECIRLSRSSVQRWMAARRRRAANASGTLLGVVIGCAIALDERKLKALAKHLGVKVKQP